MNAFISAFIALQLLICKGWLVAEETVESLPPRDQGMWQTVSMLLLAVVFFYFILWRPEQKRRKALESQRATMKKGDRVTAMGILGTVLRVQENSVILRMYDGSKIEVLKAAITDVVAGSDEEGKKESDEASNAKQAETSDVD